MGKDAKAKKPEPKCVKAIYVTLPSRNVVIKKMDDGTVQAVGVTTEFAARTAAHAADAAATKVGMQEAAEALALALIPS